MTQRSSFGEITETAFDACVSAVYQASSGRMEWNDACNVIAENFALRMVHIIGVDKRDGRLEFSWQSLNREHQGWELDYYAYYHGRNPRLGPAMALQGDEWFHDRELFDDRFVAGDEFFQEFALPLDARNLSGTKLLDDERHAVLLGVMRAQHAPPLSTTEMAALSRLRRHLVSAMETYTSIHERADRINAGDAILACVPMPVLSIDDARRVRFMNDAAGQLVEQGGAVTVQSRVLHLSRPHDDKALGLELLRLNARSADTLPRSRRFVMRIGRRDTPDDWVLVGLRIHPESSMQVFGNGPRTILMLHSLQRGVPVDPFVIGHLFGLTPAESDVATAIAQGETPEAIGERRGVSLSTVRTQIRSVYEKLDVSRQTELAWLLAKLPPGLRAAGESTSLRL